MKLDLGGAIDPQFGYVIIDCNPIHDGFPEGSGSIRWNLEKGLPNHILPPTDDPIYYEVITEIRCHHILEHIHNLKELLNDCWKLLEPTLGGFIDIWVPRFPHCSSIADPTHVRYFVEESFIYFSFHSPYSKAYGFSPWAVTKMEVKEEEIYCRMIPYTDEIKKMVEDGRLREVVLK